MDKIFVTHPIEVICQKFLSKYLPQKGELSNDLGMVTYRNEALMVCLPGKADPGMLLSNLEDSPSAQPTPPHARSSEAAWGAHRSPRRNWCGKDWGFDPSLEVAQRLPKAASVTP